MMERHKTGYFVNHPPADLISITAFRHMKTFTLVLVGPGNMNNYTINTRIGRFIEFTTSKRTQRVINTEKKQKSKEVITNLGELVFIGE